MNPIKMPKEQKDVLVENLQRHFLEERGEELGNLAAEQLLDFMLKQLGPFAYNQALADARKLVGERMQSIEDELYALEKPAGMSRRGV